MKSNQLRSLAILYMYRTLFVFELPLTIPTPGSDDLYAWMSSQGTTDDEKTPACLFFFFAIVQKATRAR